MLSRPNTHLRNYRQGSLLLISALLLSMQIPAQELAIPAAYGLPLDVVLSSKLWLGTIALWCIALSFSYSWHQGAWSLPLTRLTLLAISGLHAVIMLQQNTHHCLQEATGLVEHWLRLFDAHKGSFVINTSANILPAPLAWGCTSILMNSVALCHNLLVLGLTFQSIDAESR